MRREEIERMESECNKLRIEVENLEAEMEVIGEEKTAEKEMKYLARLIYAGKILEKLGLLYSFNEQSLCEVLTLNKDRIQNVKSEKEKKKMRQELRESRKKLEDKENEICATIDKLQNQKIEIIFTQVKKEIKREKLNVTSASILPLLEVLRKNPQVVLDDKIIEEINELPESLSSHNIAENDNSVSDIIQK